MERWLGAALDYIPQWLDFQMRAFDRPGCIAAIALRGKLVWEQAWGFADLHRGVALTPRHRFRVASHAKTFTATGILRLREMGKLKLDDAVGKHVSGLDHRVAATTIAQLLSHSAGLFRDMPDGGYFDDRRPYPAREELDEMLAKMPPAIDPNTRFKYSNIGYALLGKVIEAVVGAPYADWIGREVIRAAGLAETAPDMPLPKGVPMARGHSGRFPLGRRVVIPGDRPTLAFAPGTGVVSTAKDLALFFNQLAPEARRSILSAASRREMVRRHWRDPRDDSDYYGLGVMSGNCGPWEWFGHSGSFQGFASRTATIPTVGLTISVLANSHDGLTWPWLDGIAHILRVFQLRGPPTRRAAEWGGRWWSLDGATDLVPIGKSVFAVAPASWNPFAQATEIAMTDRDWGHIVEATGGDSFGEAVKLLRNARGKIVEVWLASESLVPERVLEREMVMRYEAPAKPRRPR